jgi:hypothetical protein
MAHVVVLGVCVTQARQSTLYERICAARSTFLYLYLSVLFYPRSILFLDQPVGLRWSDSTSTSFLLSAAQFGVPSQHQPNLLGQPRLSFQPTRTCPGVTQPAISCQLRSASAVSKACIPALALLHHTLPFWRALHERLDAHRPCKSHGQGFPRPC